MNIVIRTNRNRIPVVFIISSIITILLVVQLISTKAENNLFNWIFTTVVLLVPVVYVVFSMAEFIKTRFDKNAILEITDSCLYDNLSVFSFGNIPWDDISGIEMSKSYSANFLIIKLVDNEKYLMKKDLVQKYILKKWIKKWGSPVVISEKRIEYNLTELKNILQTKVRRSI